MPNLLKSSLERYVPPLTARNAWLFIAATVAIQNIVVFYTSQNDSMTVFALLIWGGALICMEDLIDCLTDDENINDDSNDLIKNNNLISSSSDMCNSLEDLVNSFDQNVKECFS